MTDYSLDLYYLDNGRKHGVITHLDDIKFEGNVRDMLIATFPWIRKTHWKCWSMDRDRRRYCGWWDSNWDGLYIRVHY